MRKTNNLFSLLLIIGVLIGAIFLTYSDEYWSFHKQKDVLKEASESLETSLNSQDFLNYEHPQNTLYFPPKSQTDSLLEDLIKTAQERIYVQVYILTERDILAALQDAKKRGVDVQVVLEKNVYGNPSINKNAFEKLSQAGVEVVYSSEKLFTFIHSKMLIVDDSYVISTGNLSHSTFTKNREVFSLGNDPSILAELLTLFEQDKTYVQYISNHPSLAISPDSGRQKIESLIRSAQKNIYIYGQSISDENIRALLQEKSEEGIDIKILLGEKNEGDNAPDEEFFSESKVQIKSSSSPYIHAKAVMIDESLGLTGSINFTTNSLDNNREIALLLNAQNTKDLVQRFLQDWKAN